MTAKSVHILVFTVCQSFQHTKVNSACSIILHAFCCLHNFSKLTFFFSNISFRNTSLDSDSTFQHFVGPDLGPNCLQMLSAEDK